MKQVILSYREYLDLLKAFQGKKTGPSPILNTQPIFNDEDLTYLSNDEWFLSEVKDIRKKLKIPQLEEGEDERYVDLGDESFSESNWMKSKGSEYLKLLDDKVEYIINSLNLRVDFQEWIIRFILYGNHESATITAVVGYKTILEILNNPNEILRIPLTTEEKNFIKFIIRSKLNITSKPLKEMSEVYRGILQLLNQSESSRRRAKTAKVAVETIKLKRKETYDSIIPKLFSEEEEFDIGAPKLSNRLRQAKHRLLNRMSPKNPQN